MLGRAGQVREARVSVQGNLSAKSEGRYLLIGKLTLASCANPALPESLKRHLERVPDMEFLK